MLNFTTFLAECGRDGFAHGHPEGTRTVAPHRRLPRGECVQLGGGHGGRAHGHPLLRPVQPARVPQAAPTLGSQPVGRDEGQEDGP